MVRVGFVVEGYCEKILLESSNFRHWARQHNIQICDPIINACGGGNLCPKKIEASITECRILASPDKIMVLTDLECDPCVTATKARIGNGYIDQIMVAKKALEAWFMADTEAMRRWLKNDDFQGEPEPEKTPDMPWDYLKEIARNYHKDRRGTGARKTRFAKTMINRFGFSIERAANHPNCPSAKYFLEKLQKL
ncbi:MAG: hypothetical protein ABFS56_23785 [Pseudomonadota bacterium]